MIETFPAVGASTTFTGAPNDFPRNSAISFAANVTTPHASAPVTISAFCGVSVTAHAFAAAATEANINALFIIFIFLSLLDSVN